MKRTHSSGDLLHESENVFDGKRLAVTRADHVGQRRALYVFNEKVGRVVEFLEQESRYDSIALAEVDPGLCSLPEAAGEKIGKGGGRRFECL